jgi:hypothetical protein
VRAAPAAARRVKVTALDPTQGQWLPPTLTGLVLALVFPVTSIAPNALHNRAPTSEARRVPESHALGRSGSCSCWAPLCDVCFPAAQGGGRYRMISSARISIDSGIVMPRALAALRFTTSLNLVDCSIGKSPAFAPFRILST